MWRLASRQAGRKLRGPVRDCGDDEGKKIASPRRNQAGSCLRHSVSSAHSAVLP